jgi:nucleoside-diphosphate-sugar epimerase
MMRGVFVAGHRGMVGSAICRVLQRQGAAIVTAENLDCRIQADVSAFFKEARPKKVVIAAAKVGGIHANNTYPAAFIYDNLMIESNLIRAAFETDCDQLLYLSKAGRPADQRRSLAVRDSGANQRSLCGCQDCRYQIV